MINIFVIFVIVTIIILDHQFWERTPRLATGAVIVDQWFTLRDAMRAAPHLGHITKWPVACNLPVVPCIGQYIKTRSVAKKMEPAMAARTMLR